MASAAALAGISTNGHRWKHQIRLGHLSKQIGQGDLTEQQIEAIRKETAKRVRLFLLTIIDEAEMVHEIEDAVDDLDMIDPDLKGLRDSYTRLFDLFDYWRIVAV